MPVTEPQPPARAGLDSPTGCERGGVARSTSHRRGDGTSLPRLIPWLGPAFSARGILVWETSINPKGGHVKLIGTITVVVAAVAALLVPMAGAAPTARPAAAQLSQFEGTVVSVNRDARTFRLRDIERGTARIKVTRRTRFERIAGFSALRAGMRRIEAKVKRRKGVWVAAEVERSGGGGEHGGEDDRRGGDDNGGNSGPGGGGDD
jgi:uncharacterized membrane protein YgcG